MNIENLINLIRSNNNSSVEVMHNLILSLGLNDEKLNEQPSELSDYFGKGLKMWQYPNQLSKFANFISDISVDSYLEIGCRFGGTFVFNSEILAKNNTNINLYACDIISESEILQEYFQIRPFEYIKQYSSSPSFRQRFIQKPVEFVFIDGDHSYNGVKNDFQIFENSTKTKYIVLHDIVSDVCPGVKQMWEEIKRDDRFETIEFCDQYDSVNGSYLGIGLAIRK
jgi:cephalosporin hydroxylase